MAYFETRTISGFICQIRKRGDRGDFSFLKPRRFRAALYSALHNTENGAISKKAQKRKQIDFGQNLRSP